VDWPPGGASTPNVALLPIRPRPPSVPWPEKRRAKIAEFSGAGAE